jgi:uncharacterized protein (TIGR00251 family)
MELRETPQGITIVIFVKPNSRRFQVKIEDDEIVVCCRAAPVKGRVNRELTKELARRFKRRVEILSGLHSRQKKVLIADINAEEVKDILRYVDRGSLGDHM